MASGSRCLQVLEGVFSAEARPAPLYRFRSGDGGSYPRAFPPASPAAGKKLGGALYWRLRCAARAVGAPEPAAPRMTRLLGGPSPGGAASRRRGSRPSGLGRAPGACALPNLVHGRGPNVPRGVDPTPLAVGETFGGPAVGREDPSLPARPSNRPERSEVGQRKLLAGQGSAQLAEERVKFREAAG